MESSLRKLKKKVKELKNKNVPYIEDIEFLREYISQESYADVEANFKDHTITYDRLQESTLEEMNKKILIVGSGPRDTVILIDDIDQMED